MPDQPLNPDALEAAADAVVDASFGQELPEAPIDLATAAVSAYLAVAQPVVTTLEELDKLPIGSVILDADNDAGIVEYDGVIFCETHKLSKAYVFKHYRNLRVLYTPEGGTE